MHQTAFENCQHFFDCYGKDIAKFNAKAKVVEIGSRIVEGSVVDGTIRGTAPKEFEYVGLDFEPGKGVDVLLQDPYVLPFGDASVDVVLSSSSSCQETNAFSSGRSRDSAWALALGQ